MPNHQYRFEEQWFIPALATDVYEVLSNPCLLCEWWKGVYLQLAPLQPGSEAKVGNRYEAEARGFLPYHLRFVMETAILEPPRRVGVTMLGDLTGCWTAALKEEVRGTRIMIEQICTADRWFLRLLSPVLKPLFAWNHRWTTPLGERGLTEYLRRQGKLAPGWR